MPYADPEKSFEAAVHHLFRHLTDASALRRNPLVRAHFKNAKTKTAENAVLGEICDRIIQASEECYADDAAASREVEARRGRDIISGICSEESVSKTAQRLNLSRRQYYRDRHAICTRVAERLKPAVKDSAPTVQVNDAQQLLLSRAASFCDQGLGQKAVSTLDLAWAGIPPGDARVAARLQLADALISTGDLTRAGRLLEYTRNDLVAKGDETEFRLRDRAVLIRARYDLARGSDAQAGQDLEELANRQISTNRLDEMAFDALIECGLWHCSNAHFARGRKMLARARIVAGKLSNLAPHRQVGLALLHAYCAEDVVDEHDGSYRRFKDALHLSIVNASVRGTLEATVGLMGYYASVGREDEMFATAVRALEIARAAEERRHLVFAAAWIGTTLLKTAYWRAADPLLFEAEKIAVPGTLHWVFIKEAQADLLARLAKYEGAQTSFAAAQNAARALQNQKWQAIILRDMGLMLRQQGSSESISALQHAVELAQKGAGAWTLSLIYKAASQVLPDKRVADRARRLDMPRHPKQPAASKAGTTSRLTLLG